MQLNTILLGSIITVLVSLAPTTNAFASWFVDRRLSCFTDLVANEIIMNNEVKPHSISQEPNIRIEVSPLGEDVHAAPSSEHVVKFIVPDDVSVRIQDIEYVIELSSGTGSEDWKDPPAKFTSEPTNGGVGCDGRRVNGKVGKDDSAGIVTINEDAVEGERLEITAGWATGHEAVTLTEKVVLFIGQEIDAEKQGGDTGGREEDTKVDDDDTLQDDEAEAELEELLIEEEREDINSEIETAEEDAVEALEEKRIETNGLGSHINAVEEQIIEALEEKGEDMNEALDSLKDEVIKAQLMKQKEKLVKHEHTVMQRMNAQRQHREHHDKTRAEDKLDEMYRHFQKRPDTKTDKVDELIEMKKALKDSFTKLHNMDAKELEKAKHEHIKRLPRAALKVELMELKNRAKEKMRKLSTNLGVNELMNDPHFKQIRGKLRRGLRGEGNEVHHGDLGKPLPPDKGHFMFIFFTLFGIAALVRWYLDKRRRIARKGRRNA